MNWVVFVNGAPSSPAARQAHSATLLFVGPQCALKKEDNCWNGRGQTNQFNTFLLLFRSRRWTREKKEMLNGLLLFPKGRLLRPLAAHNPFLFTQLFDGAQRANKSWRKEWTCRPAVGAPLVDWLSFIHKLSSLALLVHSIYFISPIHQLRSLSSLQSHLFISLLNQLFISFIINGREKEESWLVGLVCWCSLPFGGAHGAAAPITAKANSPINPNQLFQLSLAAQCPSATTKQSFLPFSKKGMKCFVGLLNGRAELIDFISFHSQINFILFHLFVHSTPFIN